MQPSQLSHTPLKLLFLCTHNRCRSILAEALANHLGGGLLEAKSAGSEPAGEVHPLTLAQLRGRGIAVAGLYSKSWEELMGFQPDFVITLCDEAQESCPLWLGSALHFNWALRDPSALAHDEALARETFNNVIGTLSARLQWLRQGVQQGLNEQGLVMLVRALADSSSLALARETRAGAGLDIRPGF